MLIFDFDGVLINSLDEVTLTAYNAVTGKQVTSPADLPAALVGLFQPNRFHVQAIGDAILLMNWCLNNYRNKSEQILKSHEYESGWECRYIMGGLLVQSRDKFKEGGFDFNPVTELKPTENQMDSLSFAMKIVKHIKSNAIVIVEGSKTVGIGAGQTSRVDSSMIAVRKAGERARGAVAASDAFFPMPDGLETLAEAGVKAVVEPGGSKKDPEVIEAADRLGIAMVFTGERHFKH